MNRARPMAIAATVLALLLAVLHTPSATAESGGLSHLRLTLTTTSDWARVALRDLDIRLHETVSLTPGTRRYAKDSGWTIVPGGPEASIVVDTVVELDEGADPEVVLRKGMEGTASVQVEVLNGEVPATAVLERLETNDRFHNELRVPVDAATLDIGGLDAGPMDHRRLTLAFYYPWFGADTPSNWSVGPDKPRHPYATDDADSVAAMVDQARSAGVDGLVLSWSGDRHAGSVDLLLRAVAEQPDFAVAPVLELPAFRTSTLLFGSRFDPAAAAKATRDFFARVPAGSRLEVEGRPVAFVFGMWDLSGSEWAAYQARVADLGLFVMGDRIAASHPVDGYYNYDPNGLGPAQLEARAERAVNEARLRPHLDPTAPHRLWAATVSPGLDTRTSKPLWESRFTSREGGARYGMTWQVALAADPDWVVITSWNEWYEQTHIAPGTQTGTRALDQTAQWTSRFGQQVP